MANDGGVAPRPWELVTKPAPEGDQSADKTHELWPVRSRRTACPATSQSFARSSFAVVTILVPSGDQATSRTGCVCPEGPASVYNAVAGAPVLKVEGTIAYTRAELSPRAAAIRSPIGLNATALTSKFPGQTLPNRAPVATENTRIRLGDAAAIQVPFGLNDRTPFSSTPL